jgi:hypothetical protein
MRKGDFLPATRVEKIRTVFPGVADIVVHTEPEKKEG